MNVFSETEEFKFTARLRTLHYRGAKDVPISEELTSHLMLTLFVLWCGNGTIDFCAVVKNTSHKNFWVKYDDVWFLRTFDSKMTRKSTYPELLQVVLQNKRPRLLTDDDHAGHNGQVPDNMLRQLDPPVHRVRIQGGCTAELAPADQVQSNLVLKKDIRKKLRQKHIKTLLEDKTIVFEGSLTERGCKAIATVLSEVKREWNSSKEKKDGVIRAFKQTLWPKAKKSKRLQQRLNFCKDKKLTPV